MRKGREIFDWLIRPEQMNEAEETRWHEKQQDRMRTFEDRKGKTRAPTREESGPHHTGHRRGIVTENKTAGSV